MDKALVVPQKGNSTQAERHDFWLKVINRYNESQLSATVFCEENHLPLDAFRRWCHRFKNKLVPKIKEPVMKEPDAPAFIEVALESHSTATHQNSLIYIELPNKLRIALGQGFDVQVLRTLLHTLGVSLC